MRSVLRLPVPAILFGVAALVFLGLAFVPAGPGLQATQEEGADWTPLIAESNGRHHKGDWNHYGPGWFDIDPETGVLESHGGMGLFWYAGRTFSDFEMALEFKTSKPESNSGIFLRVPGVPASDEYIYHSFEVQIHDTADQEIHRTGAVYDAEPASGGTSKPTGEWNAMRIRFVGDRISVWLNGEQVVDWQAEPRGKIRDFAPEGYIGLQNHDRDSSVWFRDIRVRDLSGG